MNKMEKFSAEISKKVETKIRFQREKIFQISSASFSVNFKV